MNNGYTKKRIFNFTSFAILMVALSFFTAIHYLPPMTLLPVAMAQSVPLGPCTAPDTGLPILTVVSGIYYGCPASPGSSSTWTQFWPVADAGMYSNVYFDRTPLRVAHAKYSFAADGGAVTAIVPASNFTLPAKSVITNIAINSTTAVTSLGSATVAVGTTAGSSASSLLAATAKASFTTNAFVQGVPVPQTASTWVKTTAESHLSVTVAAAALTAGVIEVYVFYYVSST